MLQTGLNIRTDRFHLRRPGSTGAIQREKRLHPPPGLVVLMEQIGVICFAALLPDALIKNFLFKLNVRTRGAIQFPSRPDRTGKVTVQQGLIHRRKPAHHLVMILEEGYLQWAAIFHRGFVTYSCIGYPNSSKSDA